MWFYVVNSCYEIDLLVFVFRFFWLFSNWILCGKHLNKSGVFIAIGIKHLGKPERPHLKSQEDVASLAGSFPGKMPWIIWWIMSLYQHVHIYSRATVYILYTHLSQIYIYIYYTPYTYHVSMYVFYNMLWNVKYACTCVGFSNKQTAWKHQVHVAVLCQLEIPSWPSTPSVMFTWSWRLGDVGFVASDWFRIPRGCCRNCKT